MKLVKEWDDETASYQYVLYEPSWGLIFPLFYPWTAVEIGNKAWAERIAKHYKISLESDPKKGKHE